MASVTDDFNRADASGANALGANWTNRLGGDDSFKIVSNQCQRANDNDCSSFYNGVTFTADQYSQAALSALVGTTDQRGIGVCVRCRADHIGDGLGFLDQYYALVNAAASNNVSVLKFVAGSYSVIAQRTQAWTNGDVLRLEVQGTTLRVYRNGVQMGADMTDSSLTGSYPCAPGLAGAASFATGAIHDNWSGGYLASVTTNVTVNF